MLVYVNHRNWEKLTNEFLVGRDREDKEGLAGGSKSSFAAKDEHGEAGPKILTEILPGALNCLVRHQDLDYLQRMQSTFIFQLIKMTLEN